MIYDGYRLDAFQVRACRAIDDGHSVIVAAPTGAGKTVIAEYATERCRTRSRRVIYTAPIKALSNQKFRDFRTKFGENDVGILTGDVVINPLAPVLVMTTEIFRNTIFEDVSQLDDIDYVVFDEIHYINDIERGTVWEESIIFAPQHIRFVCLSATMPNLDQFAEWMRSVREIDITVIEETERPVPLDHAIYMPGWGVGSLDDLKRTAAMLQEQAAEEEGRRRRYAPEFDPDDLIEQMRKSFRLPALYFCFSRRLCEDRARYFAAYESFLSPRDESEILALYDALCTTFDLTNDARAVEFRELIRRGIAYHHAGMLPTLKEIVERLFTLAKIQLLFTTETFAVGINMPARSVVFESLEKYDGISFRHLKAREYQQMAGRAGRRGIDDFGYVYAIVHPEYAQIPQIEHILTGEPEPIESQFNLSYSSILNLLNEHGDRMFEVCRKSFGNYQSSERIRDARRRLRRLDQERKTLPEPKCIYEMDAMELLTQYANVSREVESKLTELRPLRSRIKRRYSGRKKKRERVRRLAQINRQEAAIKRELKTVKCHGCRNLAQCQTRFSRLQKTHERILRMHDEIERIEHFQRRQIEGRLRLLDTLGYVEGVELLPRGHVARQLYGYELQITQLMFAGFFEHLDPDELNVVAVALVFESKRDEWYRRLDDGRLRSLLRAAAKEIDRVRAFELEFGIEPLMQPLEPKLAAATYAWSRGCEFDTLREYTGAPDGDLVRVFRSGADLLRQMRRAFREHERFADRLSEAIRKLNRDIVDAERQLRAEFESRGKPAGDGTPHESDAG